MDERPLQNSNANEMSVDRRITRDQWGLRLALVTAMRSTCLRRQVGCVLTDGQGHVLSTGYNGVASGLMHCNVSTKRYTSPNGGFIFEYPHACAGARAESGADLDACEAVHAEANALLQCRDVDRIFTAYVTTAPCVSCVKLLMNTGCHRIIFYDDYAASGAVLWARTGRVWSQLTDLNPPVAGRPV